MYLLCSLHHADAESFVKKNNRTYSCSFMYRAICLPKAVQYKQILWMTSDSFIYQQQHITPKGNLGLTIIFCSYYCHHILTPNPLGIKATVRVERGCARVFIFYHFWARKWHIQHPKVPRQPPWLAGWSEQTSTVIWHCEVTHWACYQHASLPTRQTNTEGPVTGTAYSNPHNQHRVTTQNLQYVRG